MRAILPLVFVLLSLLTTKDERPGQSNRKSQNKQRNRLPTSREEDQNSAYEEKHKTKERHYWTYQNVLNTFTALAALLAAGLAFAAFKQSKRQADAAWDQNRPWVSIQFTNPHVSLSPQKVVFVSGILTRNDGHIVATSVGIQITFAPEMTNPPDIGEFGSTYSEAIRKVRDDVCAKSIKNGNAHGIVKPPSSHSQPIMLLAPDESSSNVTPSEHGYQLISCVTYRYAGSDDIHHTANVFTVGQVLTRSGKNPTDQEAMLERLVPSDAAAFHPWTFPITTQSIADVSLIEIEQFNATD